ncbi:MAG: hypothetical protein AABX72_01805 [Nanoarchaeota archaeon]
MPKATRSGKTSARRRTSGIGRLQVSNANREEAPGQGGSRSKRLR